jgi:hypothetical protein
MNMQSKLQSGGYRRNKAKYTSLDSISEEQQQALDNADAKDDGDDACQPCGLEGLEQDVMRILCGWKASGWTSDLSQRCTMNAINDAGADASTIGDQKRSAAAASQSFTSALGPKPPLELQFISGPREGELVVLTDRYCTLGRGEFNTVPINDTRHANISRMHCIFELRSGRWYIKDNGSTNGTWRRMSCIMEASEPRGLASGMSFLAGTHEFCVEEADLGYWQIPSSVHEALARDEE